MHVIRGDAELHEIFRDQPASLYSRATSPCGWRAPRAARSLTAAAPLP
jgi:hypothetical protein